MLIKEESVSPRRKLFLATFGKLLIKFSGNVNVAIRHKVFSSASDETKLKSFL